jgi:hypothetical protein
MALTIGERRDLVHTIDRTTPGSHPLADLLSGYVLHKVGIDLVLRIQFSREEFGPRPVLARWVVEDFVIQLLQHVARRRPFLPRPNSKGTMP